MLYVKNTWKDQDVERPRTYEVTNNQDGSITLTDSFGLVTELGTPVNADNMNHIEDGIADLYDIKADKDRVIDYSKIAGSHVLEAPNGVCEKDSNNNIVIKAGLKLLIADGLNTNGTYKNYIYTFEEDVTLDAGGRLDPDYSRPELVFYNGVGKIGEGDFMLSGAQTEFYFKCSYNDMINIDVSVGLFTRFCFAYDVNKYYLYAPAMSINVWTEIKHCPLFFITNRAIVDIKTPIQVASKDNCDGQWVNNVISLINTETTLQSNVALNFDLKHILPEDDHVYEVIISAIGATGTASGNEAQICVGSSIVSADAHRIVATRTRTASSVTWGASAIIPIGTDRQISIKQASNVACTCNLFRIYAYRRVGTNL